MTAQTLSPPTTAAPRRRALPRLKPAMAVSLVIGALVWEALGRFVFSPIFFASFSRTVVGLQEILVSGVLFRALNESLRLFIAGFAIATVAGLAVGLLIGRSRRLGAALEDYVTVLYITPQIVLIPFILAIIGLGFWPKVLVVITFVFFPVCITTIEGARSTPTKLVEVAESFCSSRRRLWTDVVIPSTVPYFMSGIRQGIARGLVGMIAAEFLLDASGLGQLLNRFSRLYEMEKLLASVIVLLALGLASMRFGRFIEDRFAAWRI